MSSSIVQGVIFAYYPPTFLQMAIVTADLLVSVSHYDFVFSC